jgi:hypothetical protein
MNPISVELPFKFKTRLYFIYSDDKGCYRINKSTEWHYEIYSVNDIRINFNNETFYLDGRKVHTRFGDARKALKLFND